MQGGKYYKGKLNEDYEQDSGARSMDMNGGRFSGSHNPGGDATDPLGMGRESKFMRFMETILPYLVIGGMVGPEIYGAFGGGAGAGAAGAAAMPGETVGLAGSGLDAAAGALPAATTVGASAALPAGLSSFSSAGAGAGAAGAGSTAAAAGSAAAKSSMLAKLAKFGSAASPVLSAAANRQSQSKYRDQLLAMQEAENKRQQSQFAITAPGQRMRQALSANLLSNYQPYKTNFGGPGSHSFSSTGGAAAGMAGLDPATRELMKKVMADETSLEDAGGASQGGGDTQTPPNYAEGYLDKFLGGAATATSGLSLLDVLNKLSEQAYKPRDVAGTYDPNQDFA